MNFGPCKHLDYDESQYSGCEIRTDSIGVKYWHRFNAETNKDCQFCKKRGRINDIYMCYNASGFSCYENKIS